MVYIFFLVRDIKVGLEIVFTSKQGGESVVLVCRKHVYKALKLMFLPQVQSISDYNLERVECQFCGK
jgi:hypothetical protein